MSESIYCLANDASKPLKFNSAILLKYSDLCVKFLLDHPESGSKKVPILLDLSQKDLSLVHKLIHHHAEPIMFSSQDYEYFQTLHCNSENIIFSIGERVLKYMSFSITDIGFFLGDVQRTLIMSNSLSYDLPKLKKLNDSLLESSKNKHKPAYFDPNIEQLYLEIKRINVLAFELDFIGVQKIRFYACIDSTIKTYGDHSLWINTVKQIKDRSQTLIVYNKPYNGQGFRTTINYGDCIEIQIEKPGEIINKRKQMIPIKPLCSFSISSRYENSLKNILEELIDLFESIDKVLYCMHEYSSSESDYSSDEGSDEGSS